MKRVSSIIEIHRKALAVLSRSEKRRGAAVLLLVIGMAMLDAAGVASVMPFLAVLGSPEVVQTNQYLAAVYEYFAFESVDSFLLTLGLFAFGMIVLAAVFRTITTYAMNRYISMRRHSVGARLLANYIRQPYEFFLGRNTSDLAKTILSETDQVIRHVYRPAMTLVAQSIVALALIALLLFVNPIVALGVAATLGGLYAAIYWLMRRFIIRLGRTRLEANRERFLVASEVLAGVKEVKLMGRELAYLSRFNGPSVRQARHQATHHTLTAVPKYAVESLGIGGLLLAATLLITFHETSETSSLGQVLPVLGLFGFAAYRLLPAINQIFSAFAHLAFGSPVMDVIYSDLHSGVPTKKLSRNPVGNLHPKHLISVERLSYFYPDSDRPALEGIDLSIRVGEAIGIVGPTGSGKTTLVDVLLGLLRPQTGEVRVDGVAVTEGNLRAWQNCIGYVPQEIFLIDASIAENIALGLREEDIDQNQLKQVAQMAQIHDFIVRELPSGYRTVVGERGVRLSGGQRQRIGIARALYNDPSVIVLDEGTSALDTSTERAVMSAIDALIGQKTLIVIAHRLSTVRECDKVILLDAGRIKAAGTYDQLARESPEFQRLL